MREKTFQADTPKLVFETFHKFYAGELVAEVGLCAPGPLQELATNGGPLQEPTNNSVMEALLDVDELNVKNAKYTKAFRATFPVLFDTVGRGCTGLEICLFGKKRQWYTKSITISQNTFCDINNSIGTTHQ